MNQPIPPADEQVREVSLNDCPPGLFWFGQTLGFKSEYTTVLENPRRYQCDAYVVESGEYFWGGAKGSEERGKLLVRPVTRPSPVVDGLADALAAAYTAGATAVHEWWAAGNVEREADFGEAASDYARSIDLTALAMRPAPETTASDDVIEALRSAFISGHADGWRGNQLRRDVQHVDAEKSWSMLLEHGAVSKWLANLPKPTEQATSPAPDAVLRERVADAIANADLDGPDPDDYWRHLADAAIAALASPASTAEGEVS